MNNILILYTGLGNYGGGEFLLSEITKRLVSNKITNPYLLTLNFNNKLFSYFDKNKIILIKFFSIIHTRRYNPNLLSILLAFLIIPLYVIYIIFIIKKYKIKIIYPHDNLNKIITFIVLIILRNKISSLCVNNDELKNNLLDRVLIYVQSNRYDLVICVSKNCAKAFSVSNKNLIIIHPGVHIKRFSNIKYNDYRFNGKKIILVTVGMFDFVKGQDIVLRAIKYLKEKNIDISYNLIGDGVERDNLLKLSKELSIVDNVVFHGILENFDDIIYGSDVSVIPSRQEAFGLSLVESMISSIPVISSGNGGLSEIADENYVYKFKSERDLGEKILEMSNNKPLTKNRALKAREYALLNYNINFFLDSFEKSFNTVFFDNE